MNIQIRKAGSQDLDLLMEWRMRVLREVFSIGNDEDVTVLQKRNCEYYKEHLAKNTHLACFAVEEDTGLIVGCGGICYQTELPSPDNLSGTNGYIMNIYTVPEARSGGIGRSIIEYLIDDARLRGVEKIYLESSDIAKDLYREIGFTDMKDYMKL